MQLQDIVVSKIVENRVLFAAVIAAEVGLVLGGIAGLREQISPTILAVATMLVAVSILLLITIELLRRRSERLRGIGQG